MKLTKKLSNLKVKDVFAPKKIGRFFLNTFLVLPGLFFLFVGFQWLVAPDSAASALMMPLLAGAGLNSQISDIGGMFLAIGLLTMGAVTTRKGDLLFSVAVLLSCIAVYRVLSFTLHDATLIMQSLGIEIVLSVWFFIASKRMNAQERKNA